MISVLIIDDDDGILLLLKELLEEVEEQEFKVTTANTGQKGLNAYNLIKPDFILSDIKMEPLNGIELLHRIRSNDKKTPMVLMTAFADLILIEEALEIGASDLIIKPFDLEVILETINKYLPNKTKTPNKDQDDNYCRIDLMRFTTGKNIPCSLFIKIRDNHYVRLANKGDPIPKEKLIEYKQKNLKFLYVLKEEFCEFVGFNMKILKALDQKNYIENKKIVNFINYSNSILLEKTFINELNEEDIDEIKEYTNMTLSLLKKRKALFQLLNSLSTTSDMTYAHSLSTATMAYLMAKELKWNSEPTLFKVFLSGLLHDIGFKDMDKDLAQKNPAFFNDFERKEYENHPVRGMEILNATGGLPEEVILAAYQHHEDCLGKGFPRGINKNKISPISRLISCADIIDDKLIGDKKISLTNYQHALREVLKFKKNHYDPVFLNALTKVLKVGTN